MTRYIYSAIILICFALLTLFGRHEFVCNMLDMCGENSESLANKQANPNDSQRTKGLFFVANKKDTILKGFDEFSFAEMGVKPLLNDNNNAFLNKILDYLNQNPTANLLIMGHYWESEKEATSGFYENLGLARADAIRGWLELRNIDVNRLRIKGEIDNNALSHPLSFSATEKTIGVPTQYDVETIPNYTFRDMTYKFAYDSDVFTPNAAFVSYADSVKMYLAKPENAKLQILIVGHTDNIDTDAYNIKLGKGRAENAKAYFVKKAGIPASKIMTESQGEATPIATNETEEGRQRNRRVNILIID